MDAAFREMASALDALPARWSERTPFVAEAAVRLTDRTGTGRAGAVFDYELMADGLLAEPLAKPLTGGFAGGGCQRTPDERPADARGSARIRRRLEVMPASGSQGRRRDGSLVRGLASGFASAYVPMAAGAAAAAGSR